MTTEWTADCECGFFHEKNKCDKPERDAAIAAEQKKITDFIKANPWPSYKVMLKRLEKRVEWWAEYGEFNHAALKLCYENMLDKDTCFKAGESIAKRGGLQALQANFYAIKLYGPTASSADMVIASGPSLIEYHWNGITAGGQTWRA
jgi:hypothetical protein